MYVMLFLPHTLNLTAVKVFRKLHIGTTPSPTLDKIALDAPL